MKRFSLAQAQDRLGDPQAIKRGYLSEEILEDAVSLATTAESLETFGKVGYLSEVGQPYQWWADNCPGFVDLDSKYPKERVFANVCKLADLMIEEDRYEAVQSRWTLLNMMQRDDQLDAKLEDEYRVLSKALKYPAKNISNR